MEWGLRKVLPKLTEEKRTAFAFHILPVIIEECFPDISEISREDIETFLAGLRDNVESEDGKVL